MFVEKGFTCGYNRKKCLVMSQKKFGSAMYKYYNAKIKKTGLNPWQFVLLATLKDSSLNITAISEFLDVDIATVQRNIDLLIEKDMVVKKVSESDRRNRILCLSKKGVQRLVDASPLWSSATNKLIANMGREDYNRAIQENVKWANAVPRID